MIDERPFYMTVTIRLEPREDGGLRAYTDDVPGFVLSDNDPDAVMRDIIPALELLVRQNLNLNVKFRFAQTPQALKTQKMADRPAAPTNRYYVAMLPHAA